MPDLYVKGAPHVPVMTVTGHFIGMQPVIDKTSLDKAWFRADELAPLMDELAKTQDLASKALATSMEHANRLVASDQDRIRMVQRIADLESQVARRPPKRAGEKR